MSQEGRGHYKIFLGMAAGVGKTYRMLQEGKAAVADRRDVVIGILETHGRSETAALAEGLEVIPRRRVEYRGAELQEMDLPAIFQRAPELCLIDELAHTNAPGVEHHKRYEDIDDVLDAGIDVFSTVNVQHLESLNDRVAELTGVRVRETFPDAVLASADEVVLMDLTPEALIQRLREGKVYPPERIPTALNSFFRVENLSALREVALRQVAEEVEAQAARHARPRRSAHARRSSSATRRSRWPSACSRWSRPTSAQRLVRRAWRSAQRLGGRPRPALRGAARRAAARRGARAARGAPPPRDPAGRRAARRGGRRPRRGRGAGGRRARHDLRVHRPAAPRARCARFEESLPERLMRRLPGVDVRIVADPPS